MILILVNNEKYDLCKYKLVILVFAVESIKYYTCLLLANCMHNKCKAVSIISYILDVINFIELKI